MFSPAFANKIWIWSQKLEYTAFLRQSRNLEGVQSTKLSSYIGNNQTTVFGKQHHFNQINDYKSFCSQVPIQEDWESFKQWIGRIETGEQQVLTTDKVSCFEETSGTSSFSKLIPYTNTLKKEFRQGIAAWLVALYNEIPKAFKGSSYWSLSPAMKEPRKSSGGLSIGVTDDRDYFNSLTALLFNKTIAVPATLKNQNDSVDFYKATLQHLLSREDLSLVSVWSPTFFLQLDSFLQKHKDAILASISETSSITKKRKDFISDRLASVFSWSDLWEDLSCFSCWSDAQSGLWIQQVKQRIGNVPIQGKGLLSTEGIVSVPLHKDYSPVLTYRSHFYEFREINSNKIFLAHQLQIDAVYEVIITTGGGLYRYATSDLIKVTGFYNHLPCFIFIGRKNNQSDLVGEKLSETQVISVISDVFQSLLHQIEFIFLYPRMNNNNAEYKLYIEIKAETNIPNLNKLIKKVQGQLCENPYFKQAITINQLRPLELSILETGFKNKLIIHYKNTRQIKDGDIKLPVLFPANSLNPLLGY